MDVWYSVTAVWKKEIVEPIHFSLRLWVKEYDKLGSLNLVGTSTEGGQL